MFWNKKSCSNCGAKINSNDWVFCPTCGRSLKERIERPVENDINKLLEMNAPKFLVKGPMKAKGLSITITSDNISPPKIDVRPFGETKQPHHHHHIVEEKPARITKTTEEPKTKVKRIQGRQVVSVDLPDVKGLEDIEIRQLPNSMEVRAYAGDKGYFKLIPLPPNATVNNEFKDGILKIEIQR